MHVLAAVSWDPQLRGALIVLTGAAVLVGSTYLLLLTNVGARLGFLLAVAGLSGLLLLLNIIWLMGPLGNGPIGYKGVGNGWRIKEVETGDLVHHSTLSVIVGDPKKPSTVFPNGWTFLPPGTPQLASAQPAADAALIPPAAGARATSPFPPPFKTTQDYVEVAAYNKGGHNYLLNLFGYKVYWRIRKHYIYIKHQPHYVVIRVAPSLPTVTLAGAATTLPAADAAQPLTSVVMERDQGSLRLPPILLGIASLLIFALTCERLHARDRLIAERREAEKGGGGGRSRALQPA